MRLGAIIPKQAFLRWSDLLSLLAGLLPAMLVSNAAAQSPASLPVFQFSIFYNLNLEMDPGAAMAVIGPVFSNQGIWAGTANLTFVSTVAAAGQVNVTSTDPFMTGKNDSLAPPHFILAGQPMSGADPLYLRVGAGVASTNAEAILNLPPAAYATGTAAAYTTNGLAYNFNACDLIISNSITGTNGALGTNITIIFQDPFNGAILNRLTNNEVCTFQKTNGPATLPAFWTTNKAIRPTTNYASMPVASSFPFVTNVVFYDYREKKTVQAVEIDIAKFNNWLTNRSYEGATWNALCSLGSEKNHPIDSIAVYNSVPMTGSTLPAVRVVNGQQLYDRHGLTLSTPQPLYVYGDINTTTNGTVFSKALGDTKNTRPCGLMADAITVLSPNWSDSNSLARFSDTTPNARNPVATYINAATLEGIVQSTNSNYSGGVENFLRLLEAWNSTTALTYNGSIVVLFPSLYATNKWITPGTYYTAPKRDWGFDTNFLYANWLPPLTPLLGASTPPVIITQPQGLTVPSGNIVVLGVTASGSLPLGYQWSLNGMNLDDATNSSLTLINVQPNQTGNYAVLVTNAFGSTLSSNAVLTVTTTPPSLSTQPTDQTVLVNGAATFNVTATGSQPFSYQWFFNGTNLDGATNASLTLTNVQLSQAGNYVVVVANAFGSTNSANAVLTVNPPPPCTPSPSDLIDWWPGEGDAKDIAGGNDGTMAGGMSYARGAAGQAFSFDGTSGCVSVPDSPSLDSLTTNITIELWMKAAQLTANADWKGIVTKGNSSWRLQATSGAKTVAFSTSGVSPKGDLSGTRNVNDGQWHHVAAVYDGISMYIYVDGTLDVSQPANGAIAQNNYPMCIGANSQAYVPGCRCNELGYFFNGLVDEVSIYHRALSASEIQAIYNAGGSGKCALPPTIIAQPVGQEIAVGGSVAFNVTIAGNQPLSYQWQWNGTNLVDATNATLTLNNVTLDQAGNYGVQVANTAGSVVSSNGVLTVWLPPSITAQPAGCTNLVGATVNFNVVAHGTGPLNYQWQLNNTNLVDATNVTLTLNNVTLDQAGAYSVTVTNIAGRATSSNAVLSVYATAAATLAGCSFSGGNGFQFQVAGVPGFNYAVQESTNLIDWVSLITNTAPFSFEDANATNSPQQFYRAIYSP